MSKEMVMERIDVAGRGIRCAYPPEKGVLYSMRVQPDEKRCSGVTVDYGCGRVVYVGFLG
jgi:hypothetical protein